MAKDVEFGEPVEQTLLAVTRQLDEAGVPYMLIGALATFAYGEPRTTGDLDLALDARGTDEGRLREVLTRSGLQVEGPTRNDFGLRFQVLGGEVPLEAFLIGQHPLHVRELDRRQRIKVGNAEHPVISKEDLVLRKLVNLRVRKSDTDVQDLFTVLFKQWTSFDFAYVRLHCAPHRVCLTFERFVEEVRRERGSQGLPV